MPRWEANGEVGNYEDESHVIFIVTKLFTVRNYHLGAWEAWDGVQTLCTQPAHHHARWTHTCCVKGEKTVAGNSISRFNRSSQNKHQEDEGYVFIKIDTSGC